PIRGLKNLQSIFIDHTSVSDLVPIKNLKNLQRLYLRGCPNITDQEIQDLQKALPELKIYR
ncbi:MAG: leucine-rich repeat domain-containing protein, partial [Sedimentisphaerales bacterium]